MECLFAYGKQLYESPKEKLQILKQYTDLSAHNLSGNKVVLSLEKVCRNLEEKADWLMENIRKNEWIQDGDKGWFNGYYDNHGRKVEYSAVPDEAGNNACAKNGVRMMLTGQVFAIMSGTATDQQIQEICKGADAYLYDRNAGGYRLNTDFKEEKMDLGRMFGFAYGEKRKMVQSFPIWQLCMQMHCIKPVMPEKAIRFFGHCWILQWILTAVKCILEFLNILIIREGVICIPYRCCQLVYADYDYRGFWCKRSAGRHGNRIHPALMPKQYDQEGKASLEMEFAGKKFAIHIFNKKKKRME